MPAIGNMIVKKDDGTTDITWTAINGAGSDGSPAIWRSLSVGASPAEKPEIRFSAAQKDSSVRRFKGTFRYPWIVTDTVTGVSSVKRFIPISFEGAVFQDIPETVVAEAMSQFTNLVDHAEIRNAMKAQYAPI